MKSKFLYTCIFAALSQAVVAVGGPTPIAATAGFVENKGQVLDQNSKPNPLVKYLYSGNGMNVQLRPAGFSYDTYVIEKTPTGERSVSSAKFKKLEFNLKYNFHRIDVDLFGADKNAEMISEGASNDYLNFYTAGTPEKGVLNVRSFNKVTYRNIYPSIDLVFFITSDGEDQVKYNFIVHPGGNPSQIQLVYAGGNTSIENNSIKIETSNGPLNETIPVSYISENNKKVDVEFKQLGENQWGFNVPSYAPENTLVIDPVPSLVWGTFYGTINGDMGFSVVTDASDNSYTTGGTYSSTGIATAGAFQTTYTAVGDAFVVKFNSAGARQWATYYGGLSFDCGYAIDRDASNFLYIAGTTGSHANIATAGGFETTMSGGSTTGSYLVKFDNTGARQWGTYYTGVETATTTDGYGVKVDGSNNVYMCGETTTTTGMASAGAFQTTFGGFYDAFLIKFNSAGTRLWSTYFGGEDLDVANDVTVDPSDNVYITGRTMSTVGIASAGAYQTAVGFGDDVFLAKFNTSGARQWSTYYGDAGNDEGYGIVADASGVYFTGSTSSGTPFISAGAHQTVPGGGTADGFLVKFSLAGSRLWATFYGGSDWDESNEISFDNTSNVYITGFTWSTNNIATGGVYQPTHGSGGTDYNVFVAKFNPSGVRQWGTYYGGTMHDEGLGISVSSTLGIYLTGKGRTIPVTSGAYQTTTTTDVGFIAKMNGSGTISCTGFSASITASSNIACNAGTDGTATVTATGSSSPYTYSWNTSPVQTTATATAMPAGTYSVVVTSSTGCLDTAFVTLTQPPAVQASFTYSTSGNLITFNNTSSAGTYTWDYGDGNFTYQANPVYCFCNSGSYNVCLTVTNSCGTATTCQPVLAAYILENVFSNAISIYPNPFDKNITLDWIGTYDNDVEVQLVDIVGRVLDDQKMFHSQKMVMNTEALQNGIYFVRLMDNKNNSYYTKLIKQ